MATKNNSKSKIEVTPEITRQLATRKALGSSLRELEAEFGLSRPVLNRVLGTDMAKAVIKGLIDDAVASAVIAVRREFSNLTNLVTETVKHHLEEHSLEAVKIVLKTMGVDAAEKQEVQQQQVMNVILPGNPNMKDIESTHD